jgi:DNA-binding CsgD family transcriptional regulator
MPDQGFQAGERSSVFSALDLLLGLLDALDVAVSATGTDGRVFYWNPASERLYGCSRAHALGSAILDRAAGPADRARLTTAESVAHAGGSWSGICRVRSGAGGTTLVQLTTSPVWVAGLVAAVVSAAVPAPEVTELAEETDWDSLTSAEMKVAQLVAEGLTNRETAERLVISRHTVDSHLKHVFTKLDLRSRVQLTRAVLGHEW